MSDLSHYMEREFKKIRPDASLREAAQRMYEARASYLLVEDKGDIVGIITEADLARRAIPEGMDPVTVKVRALMSHPVVSQDIGTSMAVANELMKTKGFRHLAVTEKNKVVGMVTLLGLLRYFAEKSQR